MDEKAYFELPTPTEKLSHKFILDALAARSSEYEAPIIDEPAPALLEPIVETCGTLAAPIGAPQEVPEETQSVPIPELALPQDKKYFRIGEVSDLIGVESYVLRYWESEFTVVKPTKTRSGHRVYSRRDVEHLHLIRHLLHTEKFSIKGAKKKLQEKRQQQKQAAPVQTERKNQVALKEVLQEIKDLIHLMKTNPGGW